ncbi:hypothetical protein JTB14_019228 [Gonioctena quinquepunctata]|nr:hypothetical protein JTB14_019228 [Gonioctena quinquepunctata]
MGRKRRNKNDPETSYEFIKICYKDDEKPHSSKLEDNGNLERLKKENTKLIRMLDERELFMTEKEASTLTNYEL